jgi:PAS domain S-box-containing protein
MKKLSIEERGFLLVLFPLACQIVFVVFLTAQLWSIQSNIVKQSRSCELITKTISLISSSINLGYISHQPQYFFPSAHSRLATVTGDKRMFAVINDKLDQISSREEQDEVQRNKISYLVKAGQETLQRLNELRDNQQRGWKYWKHVHEGYEIALIYACNRLLDAADSVVQYEEAKRQGSEEATNTQFQTLNMFFAGAIGLTIVAAFVMAAFYIRDILIPLKHLGANCLRISRQEELSPVLPDGSEFSNIDAILHGIRAATIEEQEREKSMVENTNDLICSLSRDGKFLRANASTMQFFKEAPQTIVGKSFLDFVEPEERNAAEASFKSAISDEESTSFELLVKGQSAEDPVHTRWSCLFSRETEELFAVVHNIEQEKILEKLKQDFVDMVSHDLRSPLSSMQVSLDMIGQEVYGPLSEDALKEVRGASKNLDRLLDFVNDLLDFQKLKHGALQLEHDNASIESMVQSAIDLVKPALQAKNMEIESTGDEIILWCDPKKLVQLLTNLLANAINYTPKAGHIAVAWKQDKESVEISVTDDGPGIADEHKKRIFEAFEQTPEAVSKGEGTGLGLAICKLICDAHKGTITVESIVGQGSKFIVVIPTNQA